MDQNTLPPDEFVDSVLAFTALMTYQDHLLSRVDLQGDSPEATLFKVFATRFRNLGGTLDAGLRTYGVPMADEVRRKTRFQVGLTGRLMVNPDYRQVSEVAEKRMEVLEDLLPVVFRRFDVAESIIADARALASFKRIARAIMVSDPVGRLSELGRIPATSSAGSSFVQIIDRACKYSGIELPTLDVSIREAFQATALGDDLRKVEVQLQATDPGDAASAELADRRSEIAGKINDLTVNAVAPDAVKAAVATSVVSADGYATAIGKQERLSPAQEQGVLATGKVLLAAGAGSGKTKVMASKVVYFIKEVGVPPQSIIATSFSRKSAKELTERVKKYGGENILQGKENGFGTSHSVAAKIVNKYAKDIGLGNVVQLQGGDQTKLVRLAMEQVKMAGAAGQSPNPDDDLLSLGAKREYNPGETTRDLGEYAKDLQVSIRRLQDKLDENPNDYRLKFTLSTLNRILSEGRTQDMLSQQEKMLLQQAFAEAGVTQRVASVQRQAAFEGKAVTLGAEANRFYKESARKWFNLGIDKEHFVDIDGRPIGARRIQTFISKNKGGLKAPGAVAAGPIRDYQKALEMKLDEKEIAGAREAAIFAACYGAYEWLKKNAISGDFMEGSDFDDILINCCRVLMHSDAARSNIQKHIKVLIVDEGQDSNPCQVLMYGLIAGTHNKDGTKKEDNTMTASTFALVGDEKQSIYAFRGAEPELFINASDANGGDFKTLYLTDNYRSGSAIVEAANAVASHLSKTIPMVCKAHPSRGEGSIHCDIVKDNQEGASMFADTIAKMCKGELASEKFGDFGLGVRTNAEAMAYGVELLKRAIPFKSKLNFFNTPTAKAMIDWMSLGTLDSTNIPAMNEAVLRAHRSPNFYLDQAFTQALESQARNQNYYEWMLKGGWQKLYSGKQEWRKKFVKSYVDAITAVRNQLRGSTDAETFIQFILDLPGGEMKGQTATMLSSLIEEVKGSPEAMDMLVQESDGGRVTEEQIEAFALAPIQPLLSIAKDKTDIRGCVQYVQRLKQVNDTKSHDDEEDVDAVIIDTVHGWKGLECKHMYIPMSQGTFPHARSLSSPAEEDSERRLAYVALTRGRESVTVIAPRVNLFGKQVEPSQFVYEGCIPIRGGEDKSSMDAEKEVMKLESQRSASVLVTSEDLKALAENDADYLETRLAEIEMGSTWGGL